jgi:prepilin-type N-terminal cleavage/methylation domain-containing protein
MAEEQSMTRLKALLGSGQHAFTLVELLVALLIIGILAAVAAPLYFGYVKDATSAEAKGLASSLWTAVQAEATTKCGTAVPVSGGYVQAGFTSGGASTPARWVDSTAGAATLTVTCTTGAYAVSTPILFNIQGTAMDVALVNVSLHYSDGNPPSVLRCTTDGTLPTTSSRTC